MSFAQAIASNRGEHEVIIALSGLFSETINPIRKAFHGLLPPENIVVWHAPSPVREVANGNEWRRETAELIREAFIASLKPDVIHICSLFEGYVDDAVTSVDKFNQTVPVSISLYDLIPLLNPGHYLKPNFSYEKYYLRKIEYLKRASVLLAISEFSCQEGISHLGLSENSIVNISTDASLKFQPLEKKEKNVEFLTEKFGLNCPFVLYAGGADDRKNLSRLIRAYADLPIAVRKTHQLLLAGKISEGEVQRLETEAKSAGLSARELRFTGYVPDEALVQLYNLCKLFVFPSWHEGFGLPALEAMRCGAPVIGANTSSIPEVIGLEGALFDPYSIQSISEKMLQALTDEKFRVRLVEHGKTQAKKFSWDFSAKLAIAAFESLQRCYSAERDAKWADNLLGREAEYTQLINAIALTSQRTEGPSDQDLLSTAISIAQSLEVSDSISRRRVLPANISWRIEGPFDSCYSLALLNRETARALHKLGHRVVLHSTEGPGDFLPNADFLKKNPDLANMYALSQEIAAEEADVTSRNLYPPRVTDMACRLNLLHHYAWEESGFPRAWIDGFNLNLQGMTCLSKHVEKIMVDHGVTVPLSVSGCGVDHWERIGTDNNFHISARSFRFLHVSSCFPRKGADLLLDAYGRIFSSADDVTLIIKTFPNPHNEVHNWLAEARNGRGDFPDVQIIEQDLTDSQLKALYCQCHVLVSPSLAEGFGLPLAEAMLSNLAVITTRWGGQLDFCNEQTAWLVDYDFGPAKTHFKLFDSVWAVPKVGQLARTMREIYRLPESERLSRSLKGRQFLLENFRWEDVAERLVSSSRRWSLMSNSHEPLIGWVTTYNTRCGIASYSDHLIRSIPNKVTVLAARTNAPIQIDCAEVVRCWEPGENDSLEEAAGIVENLNLDTLVVQFNYGFFNFEYLAGFLCGQVNAGRVVVVMMHATTDPAHIPQKKLRDLAIALKKCHRVLVHSIPDLNRLKALGLVDNVSLFPHGVLQWEPPGCHGPVGSLPRQDPFTIASYGFFLPHKGLLELIEAIPLIRQKGMDVHLKMVNAEYPAPESTTLIAEAKKLISRRGLDRYVVIETEFLADEECFVQLQDADLIVFPYQHTGESSSAAVRYGLATGIPVAVTPLAIFDDVVPAVFQLPGPTPEDIAEGIYLLLHKIKENSEDIQTRQKVAERWRQEHQYSLLASRLYGMLKALRNQ
jgi:glycosyltransferase involved in cell wall biosynthesis